MCVQAKSPWESIILGHSVTAGAAAAPRLLAARVQALPAAVRLVPQPRGAFSDLALVPLTDTALEPHEVNLLDVCYPSHPLGTYKCPGLQP